MISIEEAVLYEDTRSHFIYSDKSGLIMHPGGGDCFTYFSPDGRKIRQLTKFAVKNSVNQNEQILDKLLLAI